MRQKSVEGCLACPHRADIAAGKQKAFYLLYDATNGTKSAGDIIATTDGVFNIQ
jgi:hypothetical protein